VVCMCACLVVCMCACLVVCMCACRLALSTLESLGWGVEKRIARDWCGLVALIGIAACGAHVSDEVQPDPSRALSAVIDATSSLDAALTRDEGTRPQQDVSSVSADVARPDAARATDVAVGVDVDVDPATDADTALGETVDADVPETAPVPETHRILSLGDSYTIGSGGVPEAERWPNQLADALELYAVGSEGALQWTLPPPEIVAHIGWTTSQLMAAMDAAALASGEGGAHEGEPYDLVTLLIGVNNQYQGQPLEAYEVDLAVLLDRAIALSAGRPQRVVMLSIPDYGVTPFAAGPGAAAISAELDLFNAAAQALAQGAGVHWVDIVDISRLAAEDPTLLAADGLHPSGEMYTLWAERAAPVAIQALSTE
jgi:lysophospholipase L1-like esterase